MNRDKMVLGIKYTIYALILLLFYVLQTTPGLFAIFGIRPILVVPAAVAIAMYEGEFVGGLYGALAGLLGDMGSSMLFGFGGLIIAFFCILAGLAIIHLMHLNVWNAILFVGVTMLVMGSLEFMFGYGMWGHPNVWMIYVHRTLPVIAYTTAVTPLFFWLIGKVFHKARKSMVRS
ncbi:MAG: hypothetical protein FWE32_03355 [Oscillospiraceae bacterium]|nr:hypothetical protein [Oscillospiraceae bacterium]